MKTITSQIFIGFLVTAASFADIDEKETEIFPTAPLKIQPHNYNRTERLIQSINRLSNGDTNAKFSNGDHHSRIIDTAVADESTQFARYQLLMQAGAAMLAQANWAIDLYQSRILHIDLILRNLTGEATQWANDTQGAITK